LPTSQELSHLSRKRHVDRRWGTAASSGRNSKENGMELEGKIAVVYGGGGVIGAAVARAWAREGAQVFLAGRTAGKLQAVARDIEQAGGRAQTAVVDALDLAAVRRHAEEVESSAGRVDMAFQAIGIPHVQGRPLDALSLEDFQRPVRGYIDSFFIMAKALGPLMTRQHSGVLLGITTPASRMAGPGFLGHSVACAGVEALVRHLAGELGGSGVRVACIRSHAVPEAVELGSHSAAVFGQLARDAGLTVPEVLAGAAAGTLLKRLPRLADVANAALFLASDRAGATTGAILNVNAGMILD
jgi:NAD(P)-dependent dehydrogenase (short-subunit alcohol dehydrogenase family)